MGAMSEWAAEQVWESRALSQAQALGVDLWTVAESVHKGDDRLRADVPAADYWRPVLSHLNEMEAAINETRPSS